MLQNIKELYGNKLVALDGDIGLVKDFYFNDKTWMVRYLVADTEPWLPERLVLLSPHAFGKWDAHEKSLRVRLSKKQIENSPPLESHIPVSRQYETHITAIMVGPVTGMPAGCAPLPAIRRSPHHQRTI